MPGQGFADNTKRADVKLLKFPAIRFRDNVIQPAALAQFADQGLAQVIDIAFRLSSQGGQGLVCPSVNILG